MSLGIPQTVLKALDLFLSWQGFYLAPLAFLALTVLYSLFVAIYNLYFHPLRNFPGPKHWIAWAAFHHVAAIRGQLDSNMHKFHERYGDVVRYAPNQLSFICAEAWKDIYGHGHAELPKAMTNPGMKSAPKIINANAADHFRFRRAMLPAFSEKALKVQEPLIRVYVDLLIEKLKGIAESQLNADMVRWYNLTTFDLIGDLAFGESFNGLRSGASSHWIKLCEKALKFYPIIGLAFAYPSLFKAFLSLAPIDIKKSQQDHLDKSAALAMRRIENKSMANRGDFMDFIMRSRGKEQGLTDAELASNADILIIAGSETTATLLSGVTFWLLKNPKALERVTKEVRTAFTQIEDITFSSATAKLPYMLACLDEGLRLYPPVPTILSRKTNPGPPTSIAGYMIPEGVHVGIHHSSAYWSSRSFHHARLYEPERWLSEAREPSSPYYHDNREVVKPFSYGPRDCIGRNLAYQEMRLILACVLWTFDMELAEDSQEWNHQRSFSLWEKHPLWVKLQIRDGA